MAASRARLQPPRRATPPQGRKLAARPAPRAVESVPGARHRRARRSSPGAMPTARSSAARRGSKGGAVAGGRCAPVRSYRLPENRTMRRRRCATRRRRDRSPSPGCRRCTSRRACRSSRSTLIAQQMLISWACPTSRSTRWTGLLGWPGVQVAVEPVPRAGAEQESGRHAVPVLGAWAWGGGAGAAPAAFFALSIAALMLVSSGFSATHDIAADGLYIASLSNKQQAAVRRLAGRVLQRARFMPRAAC
jgi:hypothetical protein